MSPQARKYVLALSLAIMTGGVYYGVLHHGFLFLDDGRYVEQNPRVLSGLSWPGVLWALKSTDLSNWHPLTWLSHMLDTELFGPEAAGRHAVNLLLHVLNTVVLFWVLQRMTGALWRSGFVAALFALHPCHVESVAWISARKDVLSTFFWLVTIGLYAEHASKPGSARYLAALLTFALALMAKPMGVTLPLLLLLLDYWPLGRLQLESVRSWARALIEKIPFFALSLLSSIVTIYAPLQSGALRSLESFSLGDRIGNALTSYASYIGKTLWPWPLAIFYPHRGTAPLLTVAAAAMLLLVLSGVVIRWRQRHPYLLVGWLWYLVTLLPVIGLLQVGAQAMADRYTYVPLIGLFLAVTWGVADLARLRHGSERLLVTLAAGVLAVCSILTWHQLGLWQDTATLFMHAARVTERNDFAYVVLGRHFQKQRDSDQAIHYFSEAIRANPENASAWTDLGNIYRRQGETSEAARHYRKALRADAHFYRAHHVLGSLLREQGDLDAAIQHYRRALESLPSHLPSHTDLGIALVRRGSYAEAIREFRTVLRLNPDANAHYNLGNALLISGDAPAAISQLEQAVRLNPNHPMARPQLQKARRRALLR